MKKQKVLELKNAGYSYDGIKQVLSNINYTFDMGTMYGVVGKSGAGKTTLLSLLSGLSEPTSGDVLYKGKSLKHADRYKYRCHDAGIIFQSFNLLPHLTAAENIGLSLDASGKKLPVAKNKIINDLFTKVHLDKSYADKKILKLSGGEQQRIAIARAISYDPDIILADEPTGNLDGQTTEEIIDLFKKFAHNDGKCVIIVTHSNSVKNQCDEVFKL